MQTPKPTAGDFTTSILTTILFGVTLATSWLVPKELAIRSCERNNQEFLCGIEYIALTLLIQIVAITVLPFILKQLKIKRVVPFMMLYAVAFVVMYYSVFSLQSTHAFVTTGVVLLTAPVIHWLAWSYLTKLSALRIATLSVAAIIVVSLITIIPFLFSYTHNGKLKLSNVDFDYYVLRDNSGYQPLESNFYSENTHEPYYDQFISNSYAYYNVITLPLPKNFSPPADCGSNYVLELTGEPHSKNSCEKIGRSDIGCDVYYWLDDASFGNYEYAYCQLGDTLISLERYLASHDTPAPEDMTPVFDSLVLAEPEDIYESRLLSIH